MKKGLIPISLFTGLFLCAPCSQKKTTRSGPAGPAAEHDDVCRQKNRRAHFVLD